MQNAVDSMMLGIISGCDDAAGGNHQITFTN